MITNTVGKVRVTVVENVDGWRVHQRHEDGETSYSDHGSVEGVEDIMYRLRRNGGKRLVR